MRTKMIYVLDKEDRKILESAYELLRIIAEEDVEYESDGVERACDNAYCDIYDLMIDNADLNEIDDEIDYEDDDESDGDDEDEPYTYCEYCGCHIDNEEDVYYAADGSECCCAECVDEYDEELAEYDEEEY